MPAFDHMLLQGDEYHEVDFDLQTIADDWFDGDNSAMGKFRRRKPVRVDKLLKEAKTALEEIVTEDMREEHAPRLQKLIDFAQAETQRRAAAKKFEIALRDAIAAGVPRWDLRKIYETVEGESAR